MPELAGTLVDLARLKSGSEPIVSLYLDLRWSDEHQRERVRLFVREQTERALAHYLPESPGRAGLARTLERVSEHVAGLVGQVYDESKAGLALFACESLGLWRPLAFSRPFVNELGLDAIPRLTQLARLADDVAPAIVVVPSREGADLYHVELGDLDVEASLRGYVPRAGDRSFDAGTAGESARQYEREEKNERNQETFVLRNRRAAAGQVAILFDQRPGTRVLLFGTSGTIAAFERELPERVRAQVVARLPRPRGWESNGGAKRAGVVAAAAAAIDERERRDEEAVVDAVVGEALRGGVGVMGPEDVVEALNQGRVHRLVLEADFTRTGWRCDRCDALGAQDGHATCPYCGGDTRAVHELREALVARALGCGAEVEIVARTRKLHDYRGVAAFLRQTAPHGLRGAALPFTGASGTNPPG